MGGDDGSIELGEENLEEVGEHAKNEALLDGKTEAEAEAAGAAARLVLAAERMSGEVALTAIELAVTTQAEILLAERVAAEKAAAEAREAARLVLIRMHTHTHAHTLTHTYIDAHIYMQYQEYTSKHAFTVTTH